MRKQMPDEIVKEALMFLNSGLPAKMVEMNEKAKTGRVESENRWDEYYWVGYKQALAEFYELINPIQCKIANNKLL